MQDLFSRFSCVRVINLLSRPDRAAECVTEFRKHGMDTSNLSFYRAVKPTSKPANWANYTLGCYGAYISHLTVLQEFLASGQESVLICEDDILLLDPRSQYLESIPKDFDILYFGRCDKPAPAGNQGWRQVASNEGIMGLCSYAVTRKAAAYLVNFLQVAMDRQDGHEVCGALHVDGGVCRARMLNPEIVTYILEPHICHFRASETDIHEKSKLFSLPGVRHALQLARKVKNSLGILGRVSA